MTQEVLKLALNALEYHASQTRPIYQTDQAITAIKEALAQPEPWEKFCDSNCVWTDHHPDCKLAQPEQEPVAWIEQDIQCDDFDPDSVTCEKPTIATDGWEWVPLYTTPPQRTWVDLTDTQIEQVYFEVKQIHLGAAMPWGQVQFGKALLEKFKEVNQ